jgi:RNA polymerase sigma-70 factor (ECF subfamily)
MYHKGLYIIAYRILNNTHDAQDAAQTSIIKLAKYLDRIEDLDCNKTKNLIVTIVRNTAIDIYRRKKQHPLSQLDAMSDLLHDNQPLPDDLILRMSEAKNMAEKLAKLHADYAEILTLKYYYEFNDIEISELLCISHQNARTRLHRAKKALLKLLNECNEEERNVSI